MTCATGNEKCGSASRIDGPASLYLPSASSMPSRLHHSVIRRAKRIRLAVRVQNLPATVATATIFIQQVAPALGSYIELESSRSVVMVGQYSPHLLEFFQKDNQPGTALP